MSAIRVAVDSQRRTSPPTPGRSDQRKSHRARSRRRVPFSVVALLPFVVFALVFAVYPIAQVARMAVSDVRVRSGSFVWDFNGLANLGAVAADPDGWRSVANTIVFVVATVLGSLVLGLLLALLVDRAIALLPLARNVLIWPAVIAPVVVSLMWLLILSPTAGGLNRLLRAVGAGEQSWLAEPVAAMAVVIIVDIWHWTPVVFLFLYTALKGIDASTLEAGRVDGADEIQLVRHVVLPALRPAIGAVIVVRVVMGVKAFDEMYLLTAGGPDGATTLVSQHIKTLFFDQLKLGQAAAFSLAIVVATCAVVGLLLVFRTKVNK